MLRRVGNLFTYKHMRKLEYNYECPIMNKTVEVTDYIEHLCNGTVPLICGERCQMWTTGNASDGCIMLINPEENMGKMYDTTSNRILLTCEICWMSKPKHK